jgi:hypothetical protein
MNQDFLGLRYGVLRKYYGPYKESEPDFLVILKLHLFGIEEDHIPFAEVILGRLG